MSLLTVSCHPNSEFPVQFPVWGAGGHVRWWTSNHSWKLTQKWLTRRKTCIVILHHPVHWSFMGVGSKSADDCSTTGAHSCDRKEGRFWCSTAEYLCSEYPCDDALCIIVPQPCVFVYLKKCFPVGLHSVMCSSHLICKWILSNSAKRSGRQRRTT